MVNLMDPFLQKIVNASLDELYVELQTSSTGLSTLQAQQRLLKNGKNQIKTQKTTSKWVLWIRNYIHFMALLLWVSSIIAMIAGMVELGIAIIIVIVINGTFSYIQEVRASKATQALKKLLPASAIVIRDGLQQKILAEDLVVGDLLLVEEGDRISADARIIDSLHLRADQSTLSGESTAVRKANERIFDPQLALFEYPNLLFAGTTVAQGHGMAIVYACGMATAFGSIAHLTQSVESDRSPLQKELNHLTKQVSIIAIMLSVIFFFASIFIVKQPFAFSFIFALGMIVAFIPEGLLPTVTLALAMAVSRMSKKNTLVKKLSSVETLGSTTIIATDKTGTLTQNEMSVRYLWRPSTTYEVEGIGYDGDGVILHQDASLTTLLQGFALCNNAKLLEQDEAHPHVRIIGDPTEACLLVVAKKGKIHLDELQASYPRLHEVPFDSTRKRMSTIHLHGQEKIVYVKGACKELLACCDQYDGAALSDELIEDIINQNDRFAKQGLRVLALASKTLAFDHTPLHSLSAEQVETKLSFIGLVAMQDPPRKEVFDAVQKCHEAGIRIIMITGDYGLTAKSIAKKIGIISHDDVQIIIGSTLQQLSDEQLQLALQDEVIFARVAPEQKLRIVETLQRMHHIVAVTGDGVNDAPALKKADIGVAMGLSGSDVAKESADLILTDDNFASIVSAIEEGRAVYSNIRKFIIYILNSNMPEGIPSALFLFSKGAIPLPLTIMQILTIDLGTDLFPALGLGSELPEKDIMKQPPRNQKEPLLNKTVFLKAFLWYGGLEMIALVISYYMVNYWNGWPAIPLAPLGTPLYQKATTMALASIVFCQMGMVLNCRSANQSIFTLGIFSNKRILFGIVFEFVLLLTIVYLPFLQSVFNTQPLDLQDWLFLCIWPILIVFLEELRKWITRKRKGTSL